MPNNLCWPRQARQSTSLSTPAELSEASALTRSTTVLVVAESTTRWFAGVPMDDSGILTALPVRPHLVGAPLNRMASPSVVQLRSCVLRFILTHPPTVQALMKMTRAIGQPTIRGKETLAEYRSKLIRRWDLVGSMLGKLICHNLGSMVRFVYRATSCRTMPFPTIASRLTSFKLTAAGMKLVFIRRRIVAESRSVHSPQQRTRAMHGLVELHMPVITSSTFATC